MTRKQYILFYVLISLIFTVAFAFVLIGYFSGNPALLAVTLALMVADVVLVIVFNPKLTRYDTKRHIAWLEKNGYRSIKTEITRDNIEKKLLAQGYAKLSSNIFKRVERDTDVGDLTIIVHLSEYDGAFVSPLSGSDEQILTSREDFWVIFADEPNESALEQFKAYSIEGISSKSAHPYRKNDYCPACLICQGTAHYMIPNSFNKLFPPAIVSIILPKKHRTFKFRKNKRH